jgi:hypothetical protein
MSSDRPSGWTFEHNDNENNQYALLQFHNPAPELLLAQGDGDVYVSTCARCSQPGRFQLLCVECQILLLSGEMFQTPIPIHFQETITLDTGYPITAVQAPTMAPAPVGSKEQQPIRSDARIMARDLPWENQIFDLNMRAVDEPKPKRRKYSPEEAREVARKRGLACSTCRRRKRRCTHVSALGGPLWAILLLALLFSGYLYQLFGTN